LVRLGPADVPLVEQMLREARTWALVDVLAANVMGGLVERFPELAAVLDRWAGDDDFWLRRSALLALLGPLRRGEGDFGRFSRYADSMMTEKEFFISKAIGWVLRETGKKRPGLIAEWLRPRVHVVSGITLREARSSPSLPRSERHCWPPALPPAEIPSSAAPSGLAAPSPEPGSRPPRRAGLSCAYGWPGAGQRRFGPAPGMTISPYCGIGRNP
jgi:DNA alkylation repair enzyme